MRPSVAMECGISYGAEPRLLLLLLPFLSSLLEASLFGFPAGWRCKRLTFKARSHSPRSLSTPNCFVAPDFCFGAERVCCFSAHNFKRRFFIDGWSSSRATEVSNRAQGEWVSEWRSPGVYEPDGCRRRRRRRGSLSQSYSTWVFCGLFWEEKWWGEMTLQMYVPRDFKRLHFSRQTKQQEEDLFPLRGKILFFCF